MPHRYTATLAIGLVVFLAGMVISFWVLPGLDACPDESRSKASASRSGDPGVIGPGLNSTAAEAISADGILASQSGGGDLSPLALQAVAAAAAAGGEGLALEGGRCFEGSNAMGTVRTILQVGVGVRLFCCCFLSCFIVGGCACL